MQECENKEITSKVVIELKTENYNSKGELIDAIAASAKLSKADAGRVGYVDEESITFHEDGCGCGKLEIGVNSTTTGEGKKLSTIEVDVQRKKLNPENGELVDALSAGAKLTKADAGRLLDKKLEEYFKLKVEGNCEGGCAVTDSYYNSKETSIK
ncbi:MAG TPA: hypothetical protein DCF44_00915 [Chitinophagaceae bacterium]|nr:hypothetical protein [Chitinophagaceae bacterium]